MPVAPEVVEKLKEMRKRLREAERLAGVKPDYRQPPEPASEPKPEPQESPSQKTSWLSSRPLRRPAKPTRS